MRFPARDTTFVVVASLVTIGVVQFTGNALSKDNVDKACPSFLTFPIIDRQPLIDTDRQAGSSRRMRDCRVSGARFEA